ncbi:MAG TPA: NYN domain-containing protein [Ilumatobacter sp.]
MTAPSIEPRHLRSALEFAVEMAREGRKLKPPMKYPKALDRYVKQTRIAAASLPAIARVVEGDERFRAALASGALPELVDPIGRMWLARPPGWEAELGRLAAEAAEAAEAADAASELKRAEKRRDAAEAATVRTRGELVVLSEQVRDRDATIDALRARLAELTAALDSARDELGAARTEARHQRDRAAAAADKLAAARAARTEAVAAQGQAEGVRDEVLADRAALATERSELARLAAAADDLAQRLGALSAPTPAPAGPGAIQARRAIRMPGGVLGDSVAAAEFLLRTGAAVMVDGYNVAKLAWPDRALADQRAALLDETENLVRRFGCEMTVIFDGADVDGAVADRRRMVRVMFSPAGVLADDVIRAEVRRLPAERAAVVVTNDRAIVRDVRAAGANTLHSEQLLALMR